MPLLRASPARMYRCVTGTRKRRRPRSASRVPFHIDSQPTRMRIARLQFRTSRTVANHHLVGVALQIQESLEVLLDGDPTDVKEFGSIPWGRAVTARSEQHGVHTAPPHDKVPQTPALQFAFVRLGRNQSGRGGAVEPAQEGIPKRRRQSGARRHVFGELRVKRCGERNRTAREVDARGNPERTFGGDVNRVGTFLPISGGRCAMRPERSGSRGSPATRRF